MIRVKSPDVVIEGFIIRDSGADLTAQNAGIYVEPGAHRAVIRNNDFAYNLFGMWLEKANDLEVTNNLITGKRDFASAQRGNGIQLYNCYDAKIIGNNISFVRDGIYVDVSFRMPVSRQQDAPRALWHPLHEFPRQYLGGQRNL